MCKQAILCVDDENIVLQSIKTALLDLYDHEFIIEIAESGPEALEIFGELLRNHYDIPVIISDYIMPGMKGDELLKRIHRISPQSATVLLTGQAKIEGLTNAINNANLFRYLEKPWEKTKLKEIIDAALAAYNQNQKLTEEYLSLLGTMDNLTTEIQEILVKFTGSPKKSDQNQDPEVGGQLSWRLSDDRLLIEKIVHSLQKIKTNIDSLAEPPNRDHSGRSCEVQERAYQAIYEEIFRITPLINNLKEGQYE